MPTPETRKSHRLPAYIGARIFFEHNPSTFDCLIRNISDNGAQIEIASIWGIPETFKLYIAKFDKIVECHVQWKTHNKLGICYA